MDLVLQGSCSAQLGTTAESFNACALFSGLDYPFELSWTYNSGNRTLRAAIKGSSPTGWFALGFTDPSSPGRMSGSNTVIVWQDTAATSGAPLDPRRHTR